MIKPQFDILGHTTDRVFSTVKTFAQKNDPVFTEVLDNTRFNYYLLGYTHFQAELDQNGSITEVKVCWKF